MLSLMLYQLLGKPLTRVVTRQCGEGDVMSVTACQMTRSAGLQLAEDVAKAPVRQYGPHST